MTRDLREARREEAENSRRFREELIGDKKKLAS
jgi:hypothetical protein